MNDNDNKSHRLRNIIMIIIIIIIILLLITCCTSSAFGRIGSMFNNESHINIDEDDGDKETILNGDLKFDGDLLKLYLSDKIGHLSFSYKNINPQKFTCYIKDASIATCYVKNGYVVVMPKKVGKSVLVLETLTNGKKYQATSSLEIDSANKYIKLERNNGTIDLYGSKTLYVPYTLVRLTGDVFVKVDNDDVISATLKDGVIRITGKKKGRAKVTITVKDHDKTYTETFEVTVTDSTPSKSHSTKDSDATLKNLSSKNGKIDFHKEQNKYDITVPNSTSKFSLEATPSSSKAKVTYEFNGEIVDSLEDLELKEGKNKLKVTVTAEDGSTNTYEVTIERESKTSSGNTPSNPNLSDDNYLSNLTSPDGSFGESFDQENNHYKMEVPFNQDKVTFEDTLSDNKSSVTYEFNGKAVNDLKDLELKPGNNQVKVKVKSESGKVREYTIDIYREERKIEFYEDALNIYLEDLLSGEYKISYHVLKYDKETDSWLEVLDYDVDSITYLFSKDNFLGDIIISKGYLTLKPDKELMKDKTVLLQLNYKDVFDEILILFKERNDYFISSPSKTYEMNTEAGKDIIIQNNLFTGNVRVEKLDNGHIRLYDENNPLIYIDILGDLDITSWDVSSSNSLIIHVKGSKGDHNIEVKGSVNGKAVEELNLKVTVCEEYIIILDANGGYFDELTTILELKVESNTTLDLTQYLAYKDDTECNRYKIAGYSFNKEASKEEAINSLLVLENKTLYAIYDEEVLEKKELSTDKWLYLEDVNLFHNEEYFQMFKKDKIIYPGAKGTYLMNFKNDTNDTIIINKLSLKETETICLENKKCANMAYKITVDNKEYFGSDFTILHEREESPSYTNEINLEIPSGKEGNILISWKWLDFEDDVDTYIGDEAAKDEKWYSLLVGINYSTLNDKCKGN